MDYVKLFSYFISCSVSAFILFNFMKNIFQLVYPQKIYIVALCIFILTWFAINLIGIPILNFTYFSLASFFIGCFLYHARQIKEIIQIEVLIISYALCDTTISILMSIIINKSIPIYSNNSLLLLLNVVLVQTLLLIVNKVLIIFFKKTYDSRSKKYQLIYLAIFPFINIIIIYLIIIVAVYKTNQDLTLFFLAIISPILNITEIILFKYVAKSIQLKYEMTIMQQQIEMQYNYYQQLELEYESSQKTMHDIKSHINVIEKLYQNCHSEEAVRYTKEVYNIIDKNGFKFKSQNKILNIIINEKIRICTDKKIEFIYSIEDISLSFINDIDVTTIFANLFDNAIEACMKIKGGNLKIELRIYKFNSMIIINLMNSIENQPVKDGDIFVSDKKNHKAIGLVNVKEIVRKYDGDINIEIEQNKFSVNILFPQTNSLKNNVVLE